MTALTGYKQAIMDATGVSEQDVALLEGIMRDDNRGILDDLTERQFDAQARAAYEVAKELLADPQYRDVVTYYRGKGA